MNGSLHPQNSYSENCVKECTSGQQRYVYQPPPPIPRRRVVPDITQLSTPLSRNSLRAVPPHRNIQSLPASARPTLYKGIHVLNDRLALYRHEIDFFDNIDDTAPLLGDVIDVGECGLVILKYKTSGKFNEDMFNSCAKTYSSFQLETLSDVSCLGKISPEVFALGQKFYMKILRYETSSKKEKKTVGLNFKQGFTHVLKTFNGRWPFKEQQIISTQGIGAVPTDVRRGISSVIRHVLAQILEDPRGHQSYAFRVNHGKSGKNEDLLDLPRYVAEFLKEFCLLSFGYPAASRFASFSYDDLLRENASLGARLGRTRTDGLTNFPQFQQDVHHFMVAVTEKIQRVLHDLRSTRLEEVIEDVDGQQAVIKEFVQDTNYENPRRKHARKAKEARCAKEEQKQRAAGGYTDRDETPATAPLQAHSFDDEQELFSDDELKF